MAELTATDLLRSVRTLSGLARETVDTGAVELALGHELVSLEGVDHVFIKHVGATGRMLTATGFCADGSSTDYALDQAGGPYAADWVAATARPLVVPETRAPGTVRPQLTDPHGLITAALLPLVSGGSVRAVIVLGSTSPRTWPEADLEVAATLIELAAASITLDDAQQAARIDPLTGCLNHGAMLSRLAEEISRAERQGTPLACMLLDLDNFKQVNDTRGHPAGDALLRQVADALRREYRTFDSVARYGGDEFLVILPNALGPRTDIAASRALRMLRSLGITCSVGCAQWEDETVGDFISKADEALRLGKAAGKDTVGPIAR